MNIDGPGKGLQPINTSQENDNDSTRYNSKSVKSIEPKKHIPSESSNVKKNIALRDRLIKMLADVIQNDPTEEATSALAQSIENITTRIKEENHENDTITVSQRQSVQENDSAIPSDQLGSTVKGKSKEDAQKTKKILVTHLITF